MPRKSRKYIPYEDATSGAAARDEIVKILRGFGCESVGFMDDFEGKTVLLAFTHRGRQVQLKASGAGWASLYIKAHPYNYRSNRTEKDYQQRAVAQGIIAINSILRDWVKGQITAVECGIMSFDAVFIGHMLTSDGRTVLERAQADKLLPPPKEGTS